MSKSKLGHLQLILSLVIVVTVAVLSGTGLKV
jgi:hypothetical protein